MNSDTVVIASQCHMLTHTLQTNFINETMHFTYTLKHFYFRHIIHIKFNATTFIYIKTHFFNIRYL